MKIFLLDESNRKNISKFNSKNSSYLPIAREQVTTIGCMYLDKDSILGMHQAPCHQLFIVVNGNGWVRVAEGERKTVQKGTAIFWEEGEFHESGSLTGMTAVIIEGPNLDPAMFKQSLISGN
ncbi:cupin domain-containing protein [Bacillus sp. 03113]|uniref:cupin domain-containing protein n=1 Tax=Bacillus sp. 03113 TaxID=2578211 RepID=UPI001142C077|nr:cupin [Bacillus sp. 03113]